MKRVLFLGDDAGHLCPSTFNGIVRSRIPFDAPLRTTGSGEEIMALYRQVHDQVRKHLSNFYRLQ